MYYYIVIVILILIYLFYRLYHYYYAQITPINEYLYLGNLKNANNHELLKKIGITHIISVIDLPVD